MSLQKYLKMDSFPFRPFSQNLLSNFQLQSDKQVIEFHPDMDVITMSDIVSDKLIAIVKKELCTSKEVISKDEK